MLEKVNIVKLEAEVVVRIEKSAENKKKGLAIFLPIPFFVINGVPNRI